MFVEISTAIGIVFPISYILSSLPLNMVFIKHLLLINAFRDMECSLFASKFDFGDEKKDTGNDCDQKVDKGGDPKQRRRRMQADAVKKAKFGQSHPFYECIAPLRCLLLRDSEALKWADIQQMMDHIEVNIVLISRSRNCPSRTIYYIIDNELKWF